MEEKLSPSFQNNRIIIFGPEGSWKSSILNSLANTSNLFKVSDLSNYSEINLNKNFVKRKDVLIEESRYDLYDSIGINPSYRIDGIKKKLEKFRSSILGIEFNLVLITFPMTPNLTFNYVPLQLLLKTFSFTNNRSVFLVLTKGELIESEEGREECYDTFKEELRNKVLRENLEFNFRNIIIYESNKLEDFRKEILMKSEDQNLLPTEIEIKCDQYKKGVSKENEADIKALEKLYTCDDEEEKKEEVNGLGIIDFLKSVLDNCAFLHSPNMII